MFSVELTPPRLKWELVFLRTRVPRVMRRHGEVTSSAAPGSQTSAASSCGRNAVAAARIQFATPPASGTAVIPAALRPRARPTRDVPLGSFAELRRTQTRRAEPSGKASTSVVEASGCVNTKSRGSTSNVSKITARSSVHRKPADLRAEDGLGYRRRGKYSSFASILVVRNPGGTLSRQIFHRDHRRPPTHCVMQMAKGEWPWWSFHTLRRPIPTRVR